MKHIEKTKKCNLPLIITVLCFIEVFSMNLLYGQQDWICGSDSDGIRACTPRGNSDDPAVRDSHIPTDNTPIKTVRLYIHAFANDDGTNPTATEKLH